MAHSSTTWTDWSGSYFRQAQAQPLLSREEERDLIIRAARGEQHAIDRLIESHLRFVIKIARKYSGYGLPMTDLIQEGNLGLIRAVELFDPEQGSRLATYAMWWIKAAIQDYVLRSWSLVRVGTTVAHKSLFFRLRYMKKELGFGGQAMNPLQTQALAEHFNFRPVDVEHMDQRLSGADFSLDQTIMSDEGETREWIDTLTYEGPDPEELALTSSEDNYWHQGLQEALDTLSDRERYILEQRYLLEDTATLKKVGADLGVSKERARQLERRALNRLRSWMADNKVTRH